MNERIEELNRMLAESPEDPFLQYALALETEKAGMLQDAIRNMQVLLNHDADYLPAYYQLARLLIADQKNTAASLIIDRGIQLAQKLNNRHTLAELRMLAEEISDD
jgi:predicted Zn-dependent protease